MNGTEYIFHNNTGNELSNAFKLIVTSGWANKSGGDVEATTGHFALIVIEESDFASFKDLWENDEFFGLPMPDPGFYNFIENSLGFGSIRKFDTKEKAEQSFEELEEQFGKWLDEPAFGHDTENSSSQTRVWVDLESGTYGTGKIVALDPAQTWAADFANLSDAERIEYASTRGTEMLAEGF